MGIGLTGWVRFDPLLNRPDRVMFLASQGIKKFLSDRVNRSNGMIGFK